MGKAHDIAKKMTELEMQWFAMNLKIVDKNRKLVPFVMNPIQQKLAYCLNYQKAAGYPVRAYLLKARQVGSSTYIEGRCFMHAVNQRNVHALVVAHTEQSTKNVFNITKRYNDHLPEHLQLPQASCSNTELVFAPPHDSKLQVLYAGGREIGRSFSIDRLHLSEYLFFPYETTFLGIMNAISSENKDSEAIFESTANGASGPGYERYMQAVEHKSNYPDDMDGFQPLFFSWLEVPWYSREIPSTYKMGTYSAEEMRLKALGTPQRAVTDEQLYWRRRALDEKCDSDEALFRQEYPATASEAFLCSARGVFPANVIAHHQKQVDNEGFKRYRLDWANSETKESVIATPVNAYEEGWDIWEMPQEETGYAIGADVAEGVLSDPGAERSDSDYSCAAIKNRNANVFIATFRSQHIEADVFGEELLKAGLFFNKAWICPEANNNGQATLGQLKGYAHLYYREGPIDDARRQPLSKLGFKTTSSSKPALVFQWLNSCRSEKNTGWSGKVSIKSQVLLDEEMSFVVDARGRAGHRKGSHDDMLFAHMLAEECDIICPRQFYNVAYDGPRYITERELCAIGACDPGPEYVNRTQPDGDTVDYFI